MGRYRLVAGALLLLGAACGQETAYELGRTLQGRSFEVTVHKVSRDSLIRASGSLDSLAGPAEQFIVIDATVKNRGAAPVVFHAGSIEASVAGKRVEFDRETVLSDHYMYAETIASQGVVRKGVVFRLPGEARPPFTWKPARETLRIRLPDPATQTEWTASATAPARAVSPRLAGAKREAPPAPALSYQMPYSDARRMLLEAGWQPIRNGAPEKLGTGAKALFVEGAVEVQSCADTGVAPCKFDWNDVGNQHRLLVFTEGAQPKVFGWTVE